MRMIDCKQDVEGRVDSNQKSAATIRVATITQIVIAFLVGLFASTLVQHSPFPLSHVVYPSANLGCQFSPHTTVKPRAEPFAGSSAYQIFPPPSPTNVRPDLFPSNVGNAGTTVTGTEAAVIATAPAYPFNSGGSSPLLQPPTYNNQTPSAGFNILKSWSNLSPWYSVGRTTFGLDSSPNPPNNCRVTGLHLLYRHGSRSPAAGGSFGSPGTFAARLNQMPNSWNATGDLYFLNDWTYKLGQQLLTSFGRQQMFDLGVSMRLKYGFLLNNFTETNTLPVFRTESQDRMLNSALNFASGFFGIPYENKYQQSITIESPGINNTLAPYETCTNVADSSKGDRGTWYITTWAEIYLQQAKARLQPQLQGFQLTTEDVFNMQAMCAYETVALGYSAFCGLFSEEEWAGFDYALDLGFWYRSAFGSPVARAQGIGYIQELVARLTNTPIPLHNSSTNATLDNDPITFPLGAGQSLYADATHEVVVLNVITALNLTNFAAVDPLPVDRIPDNRSFKVSQLAPFGTNVQFQLLTCSSPDLSGPNGPQIRIIINDGVTPLTGIKGCPQQQDGLCPLDTFVAAQRETIAEVDWAWDCYGNWTVANGTAWNTTRGSPPPPPSYSPLPYSSASL